MAYLPIWKDKDYDLGSASESYFRILDASSNVLYTGKAVKAPGASTIAVRVNDIIADHLKANAPAFTDGDSSVQAILKQFTIQKSSDGTSWTAVSTDQFLKDYSYDYGRSLADTDLVNMHAPITDKAAPWQLLFYCVLDDYSCKVMRNGVVSSVNILANTAFAFTPHAGTTAISIFKEDAPSDTLSWEVTCGEFALYYLNAFGGWDSLLLEGACSRKASVSRNAYDKAYDNSVRINANKANYLNERTEQYILRTGFLTDEQSERMHHLLNSTQVFLHDHQRDAIVPVRLTDNSYEVKTYKGQGGKLYQYTLNAEVLHNYIRK